MGLIILQLTRYLICEICQLHMRYTDKKKSDSESLDFDVHVTFYVSVCFSYSPLNVSLQVSFSILGLRI